MSIIQCIPLQDVMLAPPPPTACSQSNEARRKAQCRMSPRQAPPGPAATGQPTSARQKPHTLAKHSLSQSEFQTITMASPTPGGQGASTALQRFLARKSTYTAIIFCVFACGLLLMVLPAELLPFVPPEKAEINLATTFSTLSAQGWLALCLVCFGFILMIFDIVGGEKRVWWRVDLRC